MGSHREAAHRIQPVLTLLQLCATVREGIGAVHSLCMRAEVRGWLPSPERAMCAMQPATGYAVETQTLVGKV